MKRLPWRLPIFGLMFCALAADWKTHPENQWIKQSARPGAPVPRFGWEGSGDFDPVHRLWIHHAGHDGVPQGFHLFTCDLENGVWQQRFPNTSPPGVCCVDGAHVFDIAHERYVRFPGASLGHGYQWSRGVKLKNSNVWLYDPAMNAWTNMRPPPYKPYANKEGFGYLNGNATYDANHELAISFGGQDSAGETNNLFAYDAYSNALYRLNAAAKPSPRDGAGLCYDTKNDCLVLFGSQYDNDEKTWIYRLATGRWEAHDLNPHPVGKKLGTYSTIPRLAYDSRNGICLGLVWDTNKGTHETWALDVAKLSWTKMNPPAEPEPSMSRSRNLAYSIEDNVFILETSAKDGKGNEPQLWTYRYHNKAVEHSPAPPSNAQLITGADKITLTWSGEDKAGQQYAIYRARSSQPWQAQFEKIATVQGNSFEDRNLAKGADFLYQIRTVGKDGAIGPPGIRLHTQPRVLLKPVVSVLTPSKVEVSWNAHPAKDVFGYNVYRGKAVMRSVKQGKPAPWKDNDPEYGAPAPVEVRDIVDLRKLSDTPIVATSFVDDAVQLNKSDVKPDEYRHEVFAYIVRAVNRLGTESGPSPYALTIPSEPTEVFNHETKGTANLEWAANPEKPIAGYRVYKLEGVWNIFCLTKEPIKATNFKHESGGSATRYWITALDALGQEGQPSSPVWHNRAYTGFFKGDKHQ
jgi:hypothetical protein